MKILIIHNNYSQRGGEETVVAFQQRLLEENGHQVQLYTRDYNEMKRWWLGRGGGLFTALYNPRSIKDLRKIIQTFQPEVAILHNLFPIISPAIIPFLKKQNVRTIQMLHNYRLLCPIGTFYTNGEICEKCTEKCREWHCLIERCNGGFFQSLSFTLRSMVARKRNYFGAVDELIASSNFQKNKLIANGFDGSKISVIPNSFFADIVGDENFRPLHASPNEPRNFIGFAGRLAPEKGIFDFIELAHLMPNYEFRVVGKRTAVLDGIDIPENLKFEGFLDALQLRNFYRSAKVFVFPSRWYEGFPFALLESLICKTPTIVYNLSVMPEIIEDGKEGFVVEIGDIQKIAEHINNLFSDEQLWTKLSENALRKYEDKYSVKSYYDKLISKCKTTYP